MNLVRIDSEEVGAKHREILLKHGLTEVGTDTEGFATTKSRIKEFTNTVKDDLHDAYKQLSAGYAPAPLEMADGSVEWVDGGVSRFDAPVPTRLKVAAVKKKRASRKKK